jgi:hypothetical protein
MHVHVSLHMHVHVHVHVNMHAILQVHVNVHVHVYAHVHVHVHVQARTNELISDGRCMGRTRVMHSAQHAVGVSVIRAISASHSMHAMRHLRN